MSQSRTMKSDHAIIVFLLDLQVARSFERPGGLRD
jgi:hypothetical protein